jgi:hypothetical protein
MYVVREDLHGGVKMCVENKGQSVRDKPTVSHRKVVTRSLNLSKRAEEAGQAEEASAESQQRKQKLVLPPQPLPSHGAVPQDEILNKDQT